MSSQVYEQLHRHLWPYMTGTEACVDHHTSPFHNTVDVVSFLDRENDTSRPVHTFLPGRWPRGGQTEEDEA